MKVANRVSAAYADTVSTGVGKKNLRRREISSYVNQDSQDLQDSPSLRDHHRSPKKNNESIRNIHEIFEKELNVKASTTLSLPEYACAAYNYDHTHPWSKEYDDWHSEVFGFARLVKGHPDIQMLDGFEAFLRIEQFMSDWPNRDCDQNAWEQYFEGELEDLRSDFINSWEAVRFPAGYEPLRDALREGDAIPLIPPRQRGAGYKRFISLAGWLQVAQQNQNIMLPLRQLAELLGVATHTIHVYRKWAERDGLLKEEEPWVRPTTGRGRATEFRFMVDRCPELLRGKQS